MVSYRIYFFIFRQKNIFKKLISGWVFPISYWLLTLVCVSFYATVFPFVEFGKDLYMNQWVLSSKIDLNDLENGVSSGVWI